MASPSNNVDVVLERQDAYRRTFHGVLPGKVLEDLKAFCRAEESCFHADPRIHAVLEGRREVYLRIMKYINLDTDGLLQLREHMTNAAE